MKGFMFSIEALATLAVIILAVSIFWYASSFQTQNHTNLQIAQQSDKMMSIYFNQNEVIADVSAKTQYCSKVIDYNSVSKTLNEKTVCKGIK